ncbi:acyclic terpene utilization AtuA family protein [Fusibacter ferrireducens]|uniref:Acyclic terpene utilization AtuA family protein n=1 Tax=Fusibacter ferrireducens TaxID=2785058 RepID=A0ABR9ZR16_9FIRM|nr:acyclic terpene utilization AtuA family protein [Fusibacter ferrireducens]MBF4692781.1 acyclic terpene utilization AtuA family protein [Fusibacter ferrireducens]
MKDHVKILSPCGILGYGFPKASFWKGIEDEPDAIVVDAGSTDAGPHKLGANTAIVSRQACKKDLEFMLVAGHEHKIPVIIGSAGGSGGKVHVNWTLDIINEILEEKALMPSKIAVVWADIPKTLIKEKMQLGQVTPLGKTVPELNESVLDETNDVVAQMGIEPILEALSQNADIIVCGRAYDPSPFAAVGVYYGFDEALSYHLGKVLECGALSSEPGTTKDCMMGIIYKDHFEVYPTNPIRKCTSVSVAAHTFYEKDHPFLLHGPGIMMDLESCEFVESEAGHVKVYGSKLTHTSPYRVKLEGARKVAYRTIVVAGVRDPILIDRIDEVEKSVYESVLEQYSDMDKANYQINFYNYGKNGVMGALEPHNKAGHELGILFEVVAKTQELASMICSSVRSTFMHFGYEGRKSTAGNLAFPFAPSDIEFGAVYEFSVYHLMDVEDSTTLFPIEYINKESA